MNRRIRVISICSLLGACLMVAGCADDTIPATDPRPASPAKLDLQGAVHVNHRGALKIHTYTSPPDVWWGTTHIIESENALVLVDVQFLAPYAKEAREYADSLGKPIERVIISHDHPDHWFGLEMAFKDVPSYALKETRDGIDFLGPLILPGYQKNSPDLYPAEFYPPTNTLEPGETSIDGVRYVFEVVKDAETETQLVAHLPEYDTWIVQDLGYNGLHLWLGGGKMEGWTTAVGKLAPRVGANSLVLVGHGEPTEASIFTRTERYLTFAIDAKAQAATPEEFKGLLLDRFDLLRGESVIDNYLPFLFANKP